MSEIYGRYNSISQDHPTTAVKSALANKNTSKNWESGFCQTKMKHLPTILAVVQQQNLKLNQLLLEFFLHKSKCHEVCGCWYVLLNTIKDCDLY